MNSTSRVEASVDDDAWTNWLLYDTVLMKAWKASIKNADDFSEARGEARMNNIQSGYMRRLKNK